ncbi:MULTISPECIES: YjiG family protein [unclassified Campylobacter]|uniref:YjiG family protein n=1 Tax=unclassified Campylobacter TaxID=2593542 RepID=UPI001DAAE689|nr:YjiG family protein [Campylobacter sp. RM12651]MBZ7976585.1 hypothetical protein [Campylobacter sp. RM12637]MBZ7978746.1 hypothetical protein [Campylobacter sp. RM12654]MBZ7991587.1 hypothetical protein [Campylobacter sp. RM9331]MBZ8005939.1 hypothetical protein [Campylobacter sp. RM9332]ULO04112.1 putative membrane protein [Campylobacter sp. RM12651]
MNNESKNPLDIFIVGAKKGFNIALYNLIPNVLMAYVIAEMLKILGVMKFLGDYCGVIMNIFGLPGEAITILLSAWLSTSAGVGIAVNLYANGIIDNIGVSIVLPAIFLMGAQLQYLGRLLAVAGVAKKYWILLIITSILNAFICMFMMKIVVSL